MRLIATILAAIAAIFGVCGCSGGYQYTMGDQIAAAGTEAVVIVRVQRSEVWRLGLPVKYAPIRLKIEGTEGPERAAHTDDLGYAGTTVKLPATPGRYKLDLAHADMEGEESFYYAMAYAFDPAKPVVAINLDDIFPTDDMMFQYSRPSTARQKEAIEKIASTAQIIYFTKRDVPEHNSLHNRMLTMKIPDGPILLWQKQYWHVIRDEKYNLVKIQIESKLISQIPDLKQMLPKFTAAVCSSESAAKMFLGAGLKCVVIGSASASGNTKRLASWAELADKGL